MDQDLDLSILDLPLPDFLQRYGEFMDEDCEEWFVDDIQLFNLVRALKAHGTTRAQPPDKVYAKVRDVAARHGIERLLELGFHDEDGEVAFHSMWERVRFPLGTDPVEAACLVAGDGLIRTPNRRPGRYERFITVAALVQVQVRQRPILLPVRKVAEHFPCQPNTVTAWIGWAIDDGVLFRTAEHVFRSQGDSRAAEYVFGLHRWKRETHERLANLLGVRVRPADVQWTAEAFNGEH